MQLTHGDILGTLTTLTMMIIVVPGMTLTLRAMARRQAASPAQSHAYQRAALWLLAGIELRGLAGLLATWVPFAFQNSAVVLGLSLAVEVLLVVSGVLAFITAAYPHRRAPRRAPRTIKEAL